jgi:hypothetical protein
MAKDDRAVENEVANAATLPVVNVAPADACLGYVHTHFMLITKFRDFAIFECDVFDCTKYEGWVLGVEVRIHEQHRINRNTPEVVPSQSL